MRFRILSLIALVALLVLPSSACSFLFVKGPPPEAMQKGYFHCTESSTWPVIDGVFAALNGLGTVLVLSADEQEAEIENRDAVLVSSLLWTGIHVAAALYGFNKVNKCRAARLRQMQQGGGYGPYQQPVRPGPPQPAPPPPSY